MTPGHPSEEASIPASGGDYATGFRKAECRLDRSEHLLKGGAKEARSEDRGRLWEGEEGVITQQQSSRP